MTTTKTQDAPGQTGQDLTIAYAIYHPDHGFAETCTSAIDDFTDHQNQGHAILLFRQRDVAAADRLQRGWSDEAQIIAVPIPGSVHHEATQSDPAALYALRHPSGEWVVCEIHEDPKLYEVTVFRTFDEAAAERHAMGFSDCEIVPMLPAEAMPVQMAQENRRLKEALGDMTRQIEWMQRERDETPEPELEALPSEDTLIECASAAQAIEDELSWLTEGNVHDAVNREEGIPRYTPLRVLLKLIDTFDGDLRIRKTRPEDHEPKRRLIIEGHHGYNVLSAKAADLTIRVVVDEGFLEYDAAGVLHITDQGRALIGRK